MIVVSNRLQVAKGREKEFEERFEGRGAPSREHAGLRSLGDSTADQRRLLHRADALAG